MVRRDIISKVNSNGNGITEINHFDWTPGWTNIMAFELNGETHFFMYKVNVGTISISSLRSLT